MTSIFISHHREKLLHAIVYFVRNTSHCGTVKLLKLLNLLDFEHYRQIGRSVTGLEYHAMPRGPVPRALHEEIKADFAETDAPFSVETKHAPKTGWVKKREFVALRECDTDYFSERELAIMEELVKKFGECRSQKLVDFSHHQSMPWRKIYRGSKGKGEVIPYRLALQAKPLIKSEPTISKEELDMLEDTFSEAELQ